MICPSNQARLYEDFQQSPALTEVASAIRSQQEGDGGGESGGGGSAGALRALQYLRRLCSHPAMVLDWKVWC